MEQDDMVLAFSALGNPIRFALFRRLLASGAAGFGPTALAEAVDLPRTLVAHHLRTLGAARLIRFEKKGREVLYRVDATTLGRLALALQGVALERP